MDQPKISTELIELLKLLKEEHDFELDQRSYIQMAMLLRRHRLFLRYSPILARFAPNPALSKNTLSNRKAFILFQMKLFALLKQVKELLESRCIDFISLKGPAFGFQLHQNLTSRQSNDIDILIRVQDLYKTLESFKSIGFSSKESLFFLNLPNHHQRSYVTIHDEITLISANDNSLKVDLHWQVTTPHQLFPWTNETIWQHTITQEINGTTLRVLPTEINIIYLCLHGAKHAWFRLQWLIDIRDIIDSSTIIDWNYILKVCSEDRIDRPISQALYLCNQLFGTLIPKELDSTNYSDAGLVKLIKSSINAISEDEKKMNPSLSISNAIRVNRNLMLLKSGIRYKWICIKRLIITSQDWEVLKLPASLTFLYIPLRPLLIIVRKFK